jgi:chemotaxis protein MotB
MIGCCGGVKRDLAAQVAKYNSLSQTHEREKAARQALDQELTATRQTVDRLSGQLKQMGFDMDSLSKQLQAEGTEKQKLAASLEEMRRALDEYKKRAEQLEAIRRRFELLKDKLQKLTQLGLKVEIRNNRMVIRLPGDVLFESGQDKLQQQGIEVLRQVAAVIRNDPDLSKRYYQIAGHTDNKPLLGGRFFDNWGLSVMRARSVLVFLITPEKDKVPGGGLDSSRLHAAGYGETDPVTPNTTDEARRANRRVELVVMPNVEEMLELPKL